MKNYTKEDLKKAFDGGKAEEYFYDKTGISTGYYPKYETFEEWFSEHYAKTLVSSNEAKPITENKEMSEMAVCLLHNMEFIGDGQWKCTKCKIVKTNNRQTDC